MAGTDRFMHFCTDILRLPVTWVGNMLLGKRVFDAINDPVAGALIDSYRFKNGQKLLPWIKITSPFIAIIAFLLFIDWGLSPMASVVYCITLYVGWDLLYSFQDAALWGMTAAIHPGNEQRARATQWADIGTFFGGLLPGLTMAMLGQDGSFGLNRQQLYFAFALVFCLGGGFQTMFMLGLNERVRDTPKETTREEKRNTMREMLSNFAALRHNYILLLFLASEVLGALSPRVPEIYLFQQMENFNVFGLSMHPTVAVTILGAVLGFPGAMLKPFALKIFDRVGGFKRLIIISRVANIAVGVIGFFIGIHTFPCLVLLNVISGIANLPNQVQGIAMRAMISDSVEYVDWKIGQRTEGITMSMRNLMSKIGGALGGFIQARTLVFLQYNPALVGPGLRQNAHFERWIWPAQRLGPQIGALLGLIPLLMIRYPDSLRNQVESEMAQRRALAEQEINDEIIIER